MSEPVFRRPPIHTTGAATAATLPEGQECPTCHRRVPRAKKPSSPKTKVVSLRVPLDDAETFEEILEAAAVNSGQRDKGHWKYFTVLRGLVLLLQEVPDGS